MSRELEAGAALSHYRIVSKIGAGGMGEVYLAQDTKLDRKVALKILPPEFAADKERMNRFVREAKSASALNHPNIITIHEIGGIDGTHFIATEFIDGQTLTEYLKANSLDYKSALDIAVQVASALDEAHRAGIVHRDVKPDNIMIRPNGLVKILDFGIAKLSGANHLPNTDAEAATALKSGTTPGMIIGTASYMSPEQAAGRAIDARSDVFSFGVVLYEMLSGRLPFAGETAMEMIGAILHTEPQPFGAKVPDEIKTIVGRCLEKNRDERYQTIAEVCRDMREFKQELEFREKLERTAAPNRTEAATQILQAKTTTETESHNSIAVLPFTNISNDEENEHFCDGLAEELLNALAKIEDLKVAARTSAFSFKGKQAEAREIGKVLNVKNVLEGSVRRSGSRLRISVQLVNAANGFQLWSERYDREMKDIFDVQDEITLAVIDALKVKLFGDDKAAVLKRHTRSAEAHEFYLRGLSYFMRWTREFFQKAIESFEQAVAIDPGYAAAYAKLAEVYTEMSFFGFQRGFMPKAKEAARKALELDDLLGEAHNALGVILMYYDRDLPGAEREFKRATALDPGNAYINNWYGWYLALMGRFDESMEQTARARELDPLSDMINFALATIFHWSRQPARALEQYRRVLELNPSYQIAYSFLAEAYVEQGDFVAAVKTIETAPIALNDPVTLSAAAHAYARVGNRHKALEILRDLESRNNPDYELAFQIAQIYVGLGDNEQSLEWLEKAYDERSVWLIWLRVDPKFDSLRGDSRFQDLMRRLGFPPDKTKLTDESLEARTVMLSSGEAKSEQPADSETRNASVEPNSKPAINPKSQIPNPKSRWWLFGLLASLLAVGGFFGYRYFIPANNQIGSIAVLPFENRSGNADSEYLSDGLAESLIYRLSQLPDLKVSPTSSVFRYKGKETDAQVIAGELGVDAVMTGRMVQRGDNLTISVELVDVRNNKLLWGEQYERGVSELLQTQREIAAEIANKLQLKLSGAGEQKLAKRYTDNNEAYQLYLKGRYHWNKRTYEDLLKAIDHFKAAIERDANYALAYSGLADTYSIIPYYRGSKSGDFMRQAKPYAERAVELDDQLAETHTSLAFVNEGIWNWAEAERHYKRAIELNPNYSAAQLRYARFEIRVPNRGTQALARMKRALEIEPSSLVTSANLSQVYLALGDADAAVAQGKRTTELDSQFPIGWSDLAHAQLAKGQHSDAHASAAKAMEISKRSSRSLVCLGVVNASTGRRNEAMATLKELEERYRNDQADATEVAAVYAGLGDKDQAFAWLDKAFANRSSLLVDLRAEYPFAALRDDPRFRDLLRRMNLPE